MPELIMHFVSPPTPFFIESGVHTFLPGERHASRQSIDVFDIIIVSKGKLSIGEDHQAWTLHKDEAIILRPDAHHFGTAPCEEETEINWIHFQTAGAWSEMSSIHECLEHQPALFQQHRQQTYLCHSEICSFFLPKKLNCPVNLSAILPSYMPWTRNPAPCAIGRSKRPFSCLCKV